MVAAVTAGPALAGDAAGWLVVPEWLRLDRLVDGFIRQLSFELLAGFMLGIVASEAGRAAWNAGLGACNALLAFATLTTRYGVFAVLLAAVLYFI